MYEINIVLEVLWTIIVILYKFVVVVLRLVVVLGVVVWGLVSCIFSVFIVFIFVVCVGWGVGVGVGCGEDINYFLLKDIMKKSEDYLDVR